MSNQFTQFDKEIDTLDLACFDECTGDLIIDFTLTQLNEDANLMLDDNSFTNELLNICSTVKNDHKTKSNNDNIKQTLSNYNHLLDLK